MLSDSDGIQERADAFWTTFLNERLASLGILPLSSTNDTAHTPQAILNAEVHGARLALGALLTRCNVFAPISILPPEILAHIFECLALVSPPRRAALGSNGRRPKATLGWIKSATHVCRSWRATALGDPALWGKIDFNEVGVTLGREMLARARSVPLAITQPSEYYEPETDAMILAHCAQIRELRIGRNKEGWQLVQPILASPAPALEVFKLEVFDYGGIVPAVTNLFGGRADRLRLLTVMKCAFAWTCYPRSPLTHLIIQFSPRETTWGEPAPHQRPDVFLDFLAALPALELLSLDYCLPAPASYKDGSVVSLPHLVRISLSGRPVDVTAALGHIRLPSSAKLRLNCNSRSATSDECLVAFSLAAAHLRSAGETIRTLKIQLDGAFGSRILVDAQKENVVSIGTMGMDALDFSIVMSWSSLTFLGLPQSTLCAIADALPMKHLQTLHLQSLHPQPVHLVDGGPWTEMFAQSGAVQRLSVKGPIPTLIEALAHPLQPDAATTSKRKRGEHEHPDFLVLFPMLEHLHLTNVNFQYRTKVGDVADVLKAALRLRHRQKMGIKTLSIQGCHVPKDQVDGFAQFVGDVCWGGGTNIYSTESDEDEEGNSEDDD